MFAHPKPMQAIYDGVNVTKYVHLSYKSKSYMSLSLWHRLFSMLLKLVPWYKGTSTFSQKLTCCERFYLAIILYGTEEEKHYRMFQHQRNTYLYKLKRQYLDNITKVHPPIVTFMQI